MLTIIAQTPLAAYILPGVGFAAIIGVYVWVAQQKKDLVSRDVCKTQHRLENKRADERHEELQGALTEIKEMIRANGK